MDQHTMQFARPEQIKVQYRLPGQNGSKYNAGCRARMDQCSLPGQNGSKDSAGCQSICTVCTVLFVLHQYTSYKSVNNMLKEITNIKADICIYILFFSLQQYKIVLI